MTFKIALIRTGQLIFSIVLFCLTIALIGFTCKGMYKLFMLGYNVL